MSAAILCVADAPPETEPTVVKTYNAQNQYYSSLTSWTWAPGPHIHDIVMRRARARDTLSRFTVPQAGLANHLIMYSL